MAEIRRRRRGGVSAGVVKAMGIFSGVQILSIACSIVRTKFVALWIGAAGVGLFGLYNSAIDLISGITNLGIKTSAVRDIAAGKSESAVARIMVVVRRWSWVLGIVGAFLTIIFSPWLSRLTFGDSDHTIGFILLSTAVFFNSISGGELSILQGVCRLKNLAKASVWGTSSGLIVSLPLFYFLRIDSIVPSIIAYFGATLAAVWVYRVKDIKTDVKPTARETVDEGLGFVRLGIYMTVSTFASLVVSYIFMAYLNAKAGTETVGYYQAGYTIINRYIGLIFMAISMEYYPRLVSVIKSAKRTSTFVGHEMTLALITILPCAVMMMGLDDVVISLLYDSTFDSVAPYVTWALVGTVFRAVSWCMSFVILAKGDGRMFLLSEVISAALCLGLNVSGYDLYGLTGLGVSYLIWYLSYTVIIGILYFKRYRLSLPRRVVGLASVTVLVTVGCSFARMGGYRLPVIAVGVITSVISVGVLLKMLRR